MSIPDGTYREAASCFGRFGTHGVSDAIYWIWQCTTSSAPLWLRAGVLCSVIGQLPPELTLFAFQLVIGPRYGAICWIVIQAAGGPGSLRAICFDPGPSTSWTMLIGCGYRVFHQLIDGIIAQVARIACNVTPMRLLTGPASQRLLT